MQNHLIAIVNLFNTMGKIISSQWLVTETETDSLYSVITTDTEENLFLDTKSISCKINLAHPFFTRFEHFKKGQDYAPIVAIFKALTLAEIMAPDKGTKFASNLRILFNQNICSSYGNRNTQYS